MKPGPREKLESWVATGLPSKLQWVGTGVERLVFVICRHGPVSTGLPPGRVPQIPCLRVWKA